MPDDDLRRLERDASRGEPGASVSLAHALRRAGRADDAVGVLRAARHDPTTRAELARLPAWTHARGPDRTSYLDVRPIRERPRLRWHAPPPPGLGPPLEVMLLGGLAGLAAKLVGAVVLLDPETGDNRATVPLDPPEGGGASKISLAGEALFVHDDARGVLLAVHTADGRELHRTTLPLEPRVGRAWRLGDPTRPPEDPVTLRLPLELRRAAPHSFTVQGHGLLVGLAASPRGARAFTWTRLAPGPDAVHAWLVGRGRDEDPGLHVALDRTTGAVRWRAPGVLVALDHVGALTRRGRGITVRDPDGVARWSRDLVFGPDELALTPEALVVGDGRLPRLLVLDRETGRLRADLGSYLGSRPPFDAPRVAAARDVVYVAFPHGDLVAHSLDGARLWELSLRDLARELGRPDPAAGRARVLVPAPDGLYAAAGDGTIYALEPP